MRSSSRVIVIRGDLYSDTGYARATRALGGLLARQAEHVFAVSLHEHRSRCETAIGVPVISDAELRTNTLYRGAFIVNICLPDAFIRVPGAVNIGYFFWETDRLPPACFWKADMLKMDRLWAPSHWQSRLLQTVTGRADVPVMPWPLDHGQELSEPGIVSLAKTPVHRPMTQGELDNHVMRSARAGTRMLERDLERSEHAAGRSSRFDPHRSPGCSHLFDQQGDLFVAIQTDAPRKGLPLLLANWLQFKAAPEGRDARLIIKLSSLDVSLDLLGLHFHASLAVHKACARLSVAAPEIWFLYDRLATDEMRALLRRADAVVSATLGEGFGGPIAEALIEGTPVIAPRHTSIEDLVEEAYPFAVKSVPRHVKLWNNLDIYSAASLWHIVDDASFLACFTAFARMPRGARRAVAETARAALLKHAGVAEVEEILHRELGLCDGLVPRRPEPDGVRQASIVVAHEAATA